MRNPWDRLVSWWSMIDAQRRRSEHTNAFQFYVLSNARSFEEFILNCTETIADVDGDKSIMRPQLDYVSDDDAAILVSFVGRFEALDADFQAVATRLGREGLELPRLNESRARRHYRHYYDAALAEVVRERFDADLAAFGYEF